MASYDDTATVSGSVVSIENGADDVPTKSLVVTIPPTLSGVSSIKETQTGRNLLNYADITNSYRITSLTDNGDGSFTVVASGLGAYIDHVIKVKAGQAYSIKCTSATNDEGNASQIGVVNVYDGSDDTATLLLNGASISTRKGFTPTGNYVLVRNKVTGGSGTGTGTIVEPQLELGSTAHAYEPYQTPTQYTANLGRTIYGGQVDIVNGTGQDTTLRYELDENDSWSAYSGASHSFWHNVATGEDRPIKQTESSASICNYATYSSASPSSAPDFSFLIQGGQRIVVTADSTIDTLDKFKTWLSSHNLVFVCPASTPTDFTFTGQEVPTRLGYNAFWSDSGDTELTYYKDGYGFTSVTVHKETPDGEPVEETRKFHRIVYGGQADVVKGTCEPKNILDSADASHTFTSGTNTRYTIGTITLKGGVTYTFSAYQEDSLTSNTRNTLAINDNGNYTYEYATGTNYHNQSGVHSMQYTPNEDKTVTLLIWVHTPSNDVTYSEFQVEKGSSASDFAPHFEPFSFPPISMSTDEGENTLFANEGDSAITYRKAVD